MGYRRKSTTKSARNQKWNYSSKAAYFVTCNTKDRVPYFWEDIRSPVLSEMGKIVEDEWLKTPQIRLDMNISLGAHVVMPDHFHGLLMIGWNEFNTPYIKGSNMLYDTKSFGASRKNLSSIMRGFKSSVTMRVRQIEPDFKWHPRFFDSVVTDENQCQGIERYIIDNPMKWLKKFKK